MEKEEGRRRERPWDDQQLAMVSKKELIEWLQQNASNSFLKKHGLQGKVANVAKKNKKVLDESFRALFEEGASEDSFRQEKDEEETKVYRETFCRPKVRSVRPLKLLMLNFVGMNIKVYHKALLKFLPNELWDPLFSEGLLQDSKSDEVTDEMLIPFLHKKMIKLQLRSFTLISEKMFAVISSRCPNLRVLGLGYCKLGDSILERIINGCPQIEELEIFDNPTVTDSSIRKISKLKQITRLDLSANSRVSLMAIAETVLQLPKLVDLEIIGCIASKSANQKRPPGHVAMAKLLQCTSLISLNAEIWDLAAGGFLPFNSNKFPFLRTLQLPFCNMSSEDLKAIANGCPNLEVLRIDSNRSIENSGVSAICRSDSKLEFLNLLNIPYLSDPALIALAELPALKTLYIGVMHEATENGLMAFARGRSATSLDTLYINNAPNIRSEGFITLATNCTALQSLQVDNCPGVTDEVLKAIATHNHSIHTLLLRWDPNFDFDDGRMMTRLTDEGIKALVEARKEGLQWLSLPQGVTDLGVRLVVENCPTTKQLEIWSNLITDEGCRPIMQLRHIAILYFAPPAKISQEMCFTLIRALKASLERVRLSHFIADWEEKDAICVSASHIAGPGIEVVHY